MRSLRFLWHAAAGNLLLASLVLVGCSSGPDDVPELGEVQGRVFLDGQALPEAKVTFQPEKGRPSTAVTDGEGRYELMYADQPGAKVGQHTVRISKKEVKRDANGEILSTKETLPAKYNTQSTLTREVEPGENPIDFNLKSQAG